MSPTEAAIRVFAGSLFPFKKVPLLEPKSVISTYKIEIMVDMALENTLLLRNSAVSGSIITCSLDT